MDQRLNAIELKSSLHGCQNSCRTRTAIIKAKLAQQLAHLEQKPFFCVFLDLKKAFDVMDQDCYLLVLEGYGVGPNIGRLIRHFWDKAQMVCRALGNYGVPVKAGRGMTKGGPLSAKLFNLVVDAVACEPTGGCKGPWGTIPGQIDARVPGNLLCGQHLFHGT
jgi:hypothetical protein